MTSVIARLTIGLMQAFDIPISVNPFWYRTLRSGRNLYRPFYQPWRDDAGFKAIWQRVQRESTSHMDTAHLLFSLARMASVKPGEIWECGVYRGATAALLSGSCGPKQTLRLFDTFAGMPEARPEMDSYKVGSLADTSIERVKAIVGGHENVQYHAGFIPDTFKGLENSSIAFAHIDVDQYETTKACCEFIFPRLATGGIIVIDDYGRPGTPGAKIGADEYFATAGVTPVVLSTGQAMIVK